MILLLMNAAFGFLNVILSRYNLAIVNICNLIAC